ncbi:hypothetical protein VTI74DRAFT_11551 [Chaetomium olivicolor]
MRGLSSGAAKPRRRVTSDGDEFPIWCFPKTLANLQARNCILGWTMATPEPKGSRFARHGEWRLAESW